MGRAAACRVTLVEDEVDHGGNRGEALGPLDGARRLVGDVGRGHSLLRPGDALLHGALAYEEGAGDLLDREARNDAQRQRNLLCRRDIGMAANEEEAENVVAVMRVVELFGEFGLGIAEIGYGLVSGKHVVLPASTEFVERGV